MVPFGDGFKHFKSNAQYIATMATTSGTTQTKQSFTSMQGDQGDLPIMVHVRAPSTLPAGYTFEAEINGNPEKVFTCEVVSRIDADHPPSSLATYPFFSHFVVFSL